MKLKLMLLALLISAIHLGAEEAPRVWTNSDGKKINATLKSYDGAYVTLERGGRTYDIAAHTLSAEDQAYLKARDEKIEQEKAARLAAIRTGLFEMTLERKMFDEPKAYYSTIIGKSTRDALKKEGKRPFEFVSSAPKNETAKVYVPASYVRHLYPYLAGKRAGYAELSVDPR